MGLTPCPKTRNKSACNHAEGAQGQNQKQLAEHFVDHNCDKISVGKVDFQVMQLKIDLVDLTLLLGKQCFSVS